MATSTLQRTLGTVALRGKIGNPYQLQKFEAGKTILRERVNSVLWLMRSIAGL